MFTDYSSFEDLTKRASVYLESIGRSKNTIEIYNWIWRKLKVYMDNEHIPQCNSQTILDYLSFTSGTKSIAQLTHHQKHCLRCALCLGQFAETNKMIEVINRREAVAFSGEIGKQMEQYVEYKKTLKLSPKTLQAYSYYLCQFGKYLNASECFAANSLSPLLIMQYTATLLPEAIGAKHLALSIIRNFLRYLYDQKKTKRDLSIVVPKDNYKKQPRLPSTYTREEVQVIMQSIDRSTTTGKRDYSILLLAVRLGMRASDISRLEFGNIIWSQNMISFHQHKTNSIIELPLPVDVGESIIDYIKYARPTSENKRVFLERFYPHNPIGSTAVSRIANRTIMNSGVNVGKRKHGSHALRHTMASLLLEMKVSLPIISELLGHSNKQTSMCYLRIDIESLRQCALDVPLIPEAFYAQKGGAFYE